MTRIFYGEIKPGLITFLDDASLRSLSDCSASAYVDQLGNHRTIRGPHYFLVLKEVEEDLWLSAPLSTKYRTYRHLLDPAHKSGFVDQWINNDSYFIEREFWKLTSTAICRASTSDQSEQNNRRNYAIKNAMALNQIIDWSDRNPNPFLVVGP